MIQYPDNKLDTIHYNRMMKWHERDSIHENIEKPIKILNKTKVNEEILVTSEKSSDTGSKFQLIDNYSSSKLTNLVKRRRKKQNLPEPQQIQMNENVEINQQTIINDNQFIIHQNDENGHINDLIDLEVGTSIELSRERLDQNILNTLNNSLIEPRIHRYNTRSNTRLHLNENPQMMAQNIDPINEIYGINDKGKRTIKCQFCERWCEVVTGLRIHQLRCINKLQADEENIQTEMEIEIPIAGNNILELSNTSETDLNNSTDKSQVNASEENDELNQAINLNVTDANDDQVPEPLEPVTNQGASNQQ